MRCLSGTVLRVLREGNVNVNIKSFSTELEEAKSSFYSGAHTMLARTAVKENLDFLSWLHERQEFSDYTLELNPISDPPPAIYNPETALRHSWLFIVQCVAFCVIADEHNVKLYVAFPAHRLQR